MTTTHTATIRTRVRIPLHFPDGYHVTADAVTFHGLADGAEHLALILGNPATTGTPLVRLHSECLTGDVFGSARCDCGPQLREATERIATTGGILLYLRQEGRGIGLYNKLDAYALQDQGLDTYQANLALGLPEDGRDYTAAAQMLTALGHTQLNLLTNNPDKAQQLRNLGITVTHTVPTGVHTTPNNLRYLHAKIEHTPARPGVTRYRPGDRIYGQFLRPPQGQGSYAEYTLADQHGKIAHIPDTLAARDILGIDLGDNPTAETLTTFAELAATGGGRATEPRLSRPASATHQSARPRRNPVRKSGGRCPEPDSAVVERMIPMPSPAGAMRNRPG